MRNLELTVAVGLAALCIAASTRCSVGERAPSPSPDVPHASRADSEAAPARPLVDGNGEDGRPFEGLQGDPALIAAHRADPASTVTTQALVASPIATAYLVIDSVPATPPATVAKNAPVQSYDEIVQLIAASPWPQYLWGTVACLVERESKGNAGAVGLAGERGLIQIHPITWPYLAQYGITPDALFDPATNLRAGYLLFIEAGGLRPWNGGCA